MDGENKLVQGYDVMISTSLDLTNCRITDSCWKCSLWNFISMVTSDINLSETTQLLIICSSSISNHLMKQLHSIITTIGGASDFDWKSQRRERVAVGSCQPVEELSREMLVVRLRLKRRGRWERQDQPEPVASWWYKWYTCAWI